MNIVGLDVGKNYAVSCCLDCFPVNIQQYFKRHRDSFEKLYTTEAGVRKLVSLKPDGIVLEPTGHWYSHFWYRVAKTHGIAVYWIGHSDLASQRGSYGFPNKRDDEDALCLAATYFDDRFIDERGNKRFLNYYDDEKIAELRQTFLEKEQLAKLRTGAIAILRQRLSYEFPELSSKALNISELRSFTPVIGWLAGIHHDLRYDNLYQKSIARSQGIEISDYTRCCRTREARPHCLMIVSLERRIQKHYKLLTAIVNEPQFKLYHEVFDRFGFGLDNRALLLYHIYPLDKFLVDGKCWISYEKSKGKRQKRDRSLRKFQSFLGMSYRISSSGDSVKRKFGGSSIVRAHLYVWAVCQIAPTKYGYRVDTEVGKKLSDRYIEMREVQKIKGKDALIRILFKATRMLFYELVNTVC